MAGKMRSPNYPAVTLPTAIDAAGKLWASEKRTAVSHDAAAHSMGYRSLSGQARTIIGAMRQYGLIEKAEKGHLRLSDLAINILHGTDAQKSAAMAEAATTPALFNELAATHVDASEGAIQSHLITKKGFADDGARKAAKAFRETVALARKPETGYTGASEQEKPEAMTGNTAGQSASGPRPTAESGVLSLKVPYGTGALAVEIRVSGEPLKRAHIERVRKYLQLAEDDLPNGSTS